MTETSYQFLKVTLGVACTIGLYSVLYRETKLYRFFEHLFLGLATGFSIVALWTETLKASWWDPMVGVMNEATKEPERMGNWLFAILLPIGLMGYFVFSKKHNWMSRIPIGIILGFWAGQQVQIYWTTWGPQIYRAMQPVIPNNTDSFFVPGTTGLTPEQLAIVNNSIYPSEAISNLVFIVTILSALSYFFFSFDVKNKFLLNVNKWGRWMLMIGFGAIFGSTVMARFALVIDRMAYIWIEWIQQTILGR